MWLSIFRRSAKFIFTTLKIWGLVFFLIGPLAKKAIVFFAYHKVTFSLEGRSFKFRSLGFSVEFKEFFIEKVGLSNLDIQDLKLQLDLQNLFSVQWPNLSIFANSVVCGIDKNSSSAELNFKTLEQSSSAWPLRFFRAVNVEVNNLIFKNFDRLNDYKIAFTASVDKDRFIGQIKGSDLNSSPLFLAQTKVQNNYVQCSVKKDKLESPWFSANFKFLNSQGQLRTDGKLRFFDRDFKFGTIFNDGNRLLIGLKDPESNFCWIGKALSKKSTYKLIVKSSDFLTRVPNGSLSCSADWPVVQSGKLASLDFDGRFFQSFSSWLPGLSPDAKICADVFLNRDQFDCTFGARDLKIAVFEGKNHLESVSGHLSINPKNMVLSGDLVDVNFSKGCCVIRDCKVVLVDLRRPAILNLSLSSREVFAGFSDIGEAFVDGDLELLQKNGSGEISGNLSLKKAVLLEDALKVASDFDFGPVENYNFAVDIKSVGAVEFLGQACSASFIPKLHLSGKFTKKEVLFDQNLQGDVNVKNGKIIVLGNHFSFNQGRIFISPQFRFRPYIFLSAMAKIKRYNVKMDVFGLADQPSVTFTTRPFLPQEKVVGLIFGGVDEPSIGTFGQFLPDIIAKSFGSVLGDQQNYPDTVRTAAKAIGKISSPMSAFKVSPCLIDSKIDKLGATFSLKLGDRFDAFIKKDIFDKEPLSVKAEYSLTESTSVKVSRVSKDELGGELEFNFKF